MSERLQDRLRAHQVGPLATPDGPIAAVIKAAHEAAALRAADKLREGE